jgi:hypothetical protein
MMNHVNLLPQIIKTYLKLPLSERLLLTHVFQAEPQVKTLYFFADEEPATVLWLDRGPVEVALDRSENSPESWANCAIRQKLSELPPDDAEIEFAISNGWQYIFQDIVRRSPTLRYVTAVSSFTCSKMRPDGFGGEVVLITASAVMSKSTVDILEDFLNEALPGAVSGEALRQAAEAEDVDAARAALNSTEQIAGDTAYTEKAAGPSQY